MTNDSKLKPSLCLNGFLDSLVRETESYWFCYFYLKFSFDTQHSILFIISNYIWYIGETRSFFSLLRLSISCKDTELKILCMAS
jgi:hypothetical protein